MIIDFSVLKVARISLRGYGFRPFSEHIVAIKRFFTILIQWSIFRIIEFSKLHTNLKINQNQFFSSESWFSAPKDPRLTEI